MKEIKALVLRAADKLISVKVMVWAVACLFLWIGKIDQGHWIQVIMIVLGARTANELMAGLKK